MLFLGILFVVSVVLFIWVTYALFMWAVKPMLKEEYFQKQGDMCCDNSDPIVEPPCPQDFCGDESSVLTGDYDDEDDEDDDESDVIDEDSEFSSGSRPEPGDRKSDALRYLRFWRRNFPRDN